MHTRVLLLTLLLGVLHPVCADDWPQWLGPQRDGIWREDGILDQFNGKPKLLWETPLGGGYSGPAVAKGRVFVMDRQLKQATPDTPLGVQPGTERVLCLDEQTGKVLWQHEYACPYDINYPAGPRCTPTVDGDRVYALGAMGNLVCLQVADGRLLWQRDFVKEFGARLPIWGFAAHPLVDGRRLICLSGGKHGVAIAFDKMTGKLLWGSLAGDHPGYCPPVIHEAGGRRQLIIWHPGALCSVNPANGDVYWSQPFRVKAGLTIPTPRRQGDLLFVTSFYNGPLMMRLDHNAPKATELWRATGRNERNTQQLHAIMCTPFIEDGHIYGVCSYGQFRCLRTDTGARVWETFAPVTGKEGRWANAFLVKHADRFFIHNELGDLIIAKLSPKGYEEISRVNLITPTNVARGRKVIWSHPAFANRNIYLRNDKLIRAYSLAK